MLDSTDAVGLAAGLSTSVLWVASALCFTRASGGLGALAVNALRLVVAVVLLGVTHRLLADSWWPDLDGRQHVLLAASGFVGLTLGDMALFQAFLDIGTRLTLLLMTTAPLFAALSGWLALDERLGIPAVAGIALTTAGVAWVVSEREAGGGRTATARKARGVVLGLTAAVAQAAGLLLSKQGMGHGVDGGVRLDPQAATYVRMAWATVGVVPMIVVFRWMGATRPARPERVGPALLALLGGAVTGPFVGVWLSLVAADAVPIGIAQTLCSLQPVFILPVAALLLGERIGVRATLGAVAAVAGVALLAA